MLLFLAANAALTISEVFLAIARLLIWCPGAPLVFRIIRRHESVVGSTNHQLLGCVSVESVPLIAAYPGEQPSISSSPLLLQTLSGLRDCCGPSLPQAESSISLWVPTDAAAWSDRRGA